MTSRIQVSFIIIAYNEEKSIGNCLASILSQNDLKCFEIIVVNDGSTDSTAKVVESFAHKNKNIKLITLSPNQGRGAARDTGVKNATGEFIAFIDADIILPSNWLSVCLEEIVNYDAVGGIAVPDGDVNYIYTKFNLVPKVAKHSTTVTGSNGLYRRSIFHNISFDPKSRDGEDFVFNKQLLSKKYRLKTIEKLIVDHRETKNFFQALKWLYQSGLGASRLLKQFGKIRLPDLTFVGTVFTVSISLLLTIYSKDFSYIVVFVLYLLVVASSHVLTKFDLNTENTLSFIGAIIVDSLMLLSYFSGRLLGIFIEQKK